MADKIQIEYPVPDGEENRALAIVTAYAIEAADESGIRILWLKGAFEGPELMKQWLRANLARALRTAADRVESGEVEIDAAMGKVTIHHDEPKGLVN